MTTAYPLALAQPGERVRIARLQGGDGVAMRLTDLGLNAGSEVRVAHRQGLLLARRSRHRSPYRSAARRGASARCRLDRSSQRCVSGSGRARSVTPSRSSSARFRSTPHR
ncbi:MAG: ferrous iron transport protein A [Trueperaceae bacterium]